MESLKGSVTEDTSVVEAITNIEPVISTFDFKAVGEALEETVNTPTGIVAALQDLLLPSTWTDESIVKGAHDLFGSHVTVYKKNDDRIDDLCATIYAFHFESKSNNHHVLYFSKDEAFMRRKILHYFIPFNGDYLMDTDQVSIFNTFWERKRQSMGNATVGWTTFVDNVKYQEYVADKKFPLFAHVTYLKNELVSKYKYSLLSYVEDVSGPGVKEENVGSVKAAEALASETKNDAATAAGKGAAVGNNAEPVEK